MQIPEDKWYDAIFKRRSRRQFTGIPLTPEEVTYLIDFSQELNRNVGGVRVEIVNQSLILCSKVPSDLTVKLKVLRLTSLSLAN